MTPKQIIDRVKALMEEVTPFDEGLAVLQSDVKPITSYIEDSLQSSCDELLLNCPLHLTTAVLLPTAGMTSKTVDRKQVGFIPVPSDFLRLHTFKMKGWERSVHRPISTENPQYYWQSNPTLRGGNAKPILAKNSDKLEVYTYSATDTVDTSLYVARVEVNDNFIKLNNKLYEPLCLITAANVLSIFGSAQAKVMTERLMNIFKAETL